MPRPLMLACLLATYLLAPNAADETTYHIWSMIRNEKRVLPTRRMGVIAVREMARHRYRQSQFAGLTRLQLDEVGRERQVQRQGRQRAEALAEGSVELAQAMVPLAGALARGGG